MVPASILALKSSVGFATVVLRLAWERTASPHLHLARFYTSIYPCLKWPEEKWGRQTNEERTIKRKSVYSIFGTLRSFITQGICLQSQKKNNNKDRADLHVPSSIAPKSACQFVSLSACLSEKGPGQCRKCERPSSAQVPHHHPSPHNRCFRGLKNATHLPFKSHI